jgi:hypothetical protein
LNDLKLLLGKGIFMDKLMKLKIATTIGDITINDVQEYVCGRKYFYINVLTGNNGDLFDIKTINRNIITSVFRCDGKAEWSVHLKSFKEKFE